MSWTLCLQPDRALSRCSIGQAIANHKAIFWPTMSSSRMPTECHASGQRASGSVRSIVPDRSTAGCSCPLTM